MTEESVYLTICKDLIEKKLGWGTSENWQAPDFETLAEKILEETKVMLSSSTLKRIWGKVQYNSIPNRATLDALACFAGFENWRALTATDFETKTVATLPRFRFPYKISLAVLGSIILLTFIGFQFRKGQAPVLEFEKVRFSSRPVTTGLPNTVIFQYDVTNSTADSVFIQQSWDPKKRFKVDKQGHEFTSTYYYPGYYRAKLLLNDSVVKEHDIYIETGGWVGIIAKEPVPVYLPGPFSDKQLLLTKEKFAALEGDRQNEAPVFSLTNVDKEMNIPGDNFSLHVALQHTYSGSNAVCQYTNIILMGTNGVIDIPLCNMGCVGEVGLMLGRQYLAGKTHDLSGFGVDFSKEVQLYCETKNGLIKIAVNGTQVYTGDYKPDIGRIVGTQVKFNGSGVVRQFELREKKNKNVHIAENRNLFTL